MSSKTLRASDLAQLTGSECWYRHPLYPSITYTDGAQYVAEAGGAYWLLDAIVSHQRDARVRAQKFQVWILKVAGRAKRCSRVRGWRRQSRDVSGHLIHRFPAAGDHALASEQRHFPAERILS